MKYEVQNKGLELYVRLVRQMRMKRFALQGFIILKAF